MLFPLLLALVAQGGPVFETLDIKPPTEAEFRALQNPASSSRLEIFDVADLIGAEDNTVKASEAARRGQALEKLAQIIVSKLSDEANQALTRIEVAAPGSLIVEGGPKAINSVRDFLDAQRRQTAPLTLTLSMVEAPHDLLTKLGVNGSSMLFDDVDSYRKLRRELSEAEGVNIMSAPRIAFGARKHASISTQNQVAYVKDYDLRIVEPGHAELLDPVIDVVEEGVVVDLEGVPMPSGTVDFEVEVVYSQLARPIPTVKKRFGAGDAHEVEVSLPEVTKVNINALVSMRPGSAALIASAAPDKERDFIVLIHFERPIKVSSPQVDALFRSMSEGHYEHRWFPPLEWRDIPALLSFATDERAFTSYPRSPLGDIRPPAVVAGACALWFIEGLREEGHCPSFAPLLVEDGKSLDASPTSQRKLLGSAARAYREWFQAYGDGSLPADAPCPLADVGLSWL